MLESLDHHSSMVYDDKIWVTSGKNVRDFKPGTTEYIQKISSSNINMVYDPSSDTWAVLDQLPYTRSLPSL